ncbi:MAG: hypothetical protein F9K27_00790 [Anaerolineae bacterium]|nr:MAG: hypothetical protein F9K27_00790 [Anaerolineae bacterium]
MSETKPLLAQAKQLMKTDKKKAKELLLKVVDIDQRNEEAWLYMSGVVDSGEEQKICLENVLSINPNNERARKGLETLLKKLGQAPPPAPPKEPAPLADDPWASLGGAFGNDNPFGNTSSPWGSIDTTPAPAEPDWMSSSPGFGATEVPALPMDGNPFGDADPWGGSLAASSDAVAEVNPWNNVPSAPSTPPTTNFFEDEVPTSTNSFADEIIPPKSGMEFAPQFKIEDDFQFDEIGESVGAFSFEDDDDARAVFGDALDDVDDQSHTDPFAPEKPRRGVLNEASRYYSQIPDELKLPVEKAGRATLLAIGVLGFLNVLALVGIVLAL